MSRSRNGLLPALQGSSPQPTEEAWHTPRAESRALVRIDNLEDRLVSQERTTQTLLDRAYKVKEDVINNLEYTHGSWQEEKKARVLLQEHIRTITDVVRKLSKDIMVLEDQLRGRDGTTENTTSAVRNLESQSVSGITDLRGRVGRCDGAISKLSADLKDCYDAIRAENQQHTDSSSRVTEKLLAIDAKYNILMTRLETLSSEHHLQLKHVETDSTQQLNALDGRARLLVEDVRGSVNSLRSMEQSERDKLEARIVGQLEKSLIQRDITSEKLDRKMDDTVKELTRRVVRLETELAEERARNTQLHQSLEAKVNDTMESQLRKQFEEIAKVKRECRDGFGTVHESITNMKEVMDGKRKLLEEQLRKEITHIRKMVVLI